ncbi:helix-turn-helix domain-containing protein [Candidatus Izemoplasma sp. B36]|uniref:helix-turn-helix domain-containing protein n=1 Tax=Candidatus Izemoplasma sp. B36 TaxID=3242468 RepID=UPI003558DED6
MKKFCNDVFKKFDLPFETYFTECINHKDITHEEMEVVWVLRGYAEVICEGIKHILKPNTVIMIYMNKKHSIKSTKGSIIVSYRLKKEYLYQNNLYFDRLAYKERVYTFDELATKYHQIPLLIVEIMKLLLSEEKRDIARYKIIGYYNMYIFELYTMLLKERYLDVKKINYDEYLNRIHMIIEYIYTNYHRNITLSDLAEKLDISTFRLSHFFKESIGLSFKSFLQNSRFEHALIKIKHTKKPMLEIAKECGFSDHKYLNRMMKERFNTTPVKFRNNLELEKKENDISAPNASFIAELKNCIRIIENTKKYKHLIGLSTKM